MSFPDNANRRGQGRDIESLAQISANPVEYFEITPFFLLNSRPFQSSSQKALLSTLSSRLVKIPTRASKA